MKYEWRIFRDAGAAGGGAGGGGGSGSGAGSGAGGAGDGGGGAGGSGGGSGGAGGGAAGGAGGAAGDGAGGGAAPHFSDSFAPDLKGFIQNKNFKDVTMLAESYRALEGFRGVPPEQLAKIPQGEDKAAWDELYNRLGRPAKADDYKVPMPEKGGDEAFAKAARGLFHEAGLTVRQGEALTNAWNKFVNDQNEAFTKAAGDKQLEEEKGLKTKWGAAHAHNTAVAKGAAKEFGVDEATIATLEKQVGFSAVMEMFYKIGKGLGEDKFIGGGNGGGNGSVLTPEAAKSRIAELLGDAEWQAKRLDGDRDKAAEWTRLHKFAYPESA